MWIIIDNTTKKVASEIYFSYEEAVKKCKDLQLPVTDFIYLIAYLDIGGY